jgi:predicted transcriptional regulator
MKESLLEKASIFLLRKGFTLKNLSRTCFDLVARGQENILLIKILEDANSITAEMAEEMHKISSYLNAAPLIIAEKAGSLLENNVVYLRFGIVTLNCTTFQNSVEDRLPFIKRGQAGLIAEINPGKFRQKRENLGLSLNSLAKKLGVSARMISKYEQGQSKITLKKAYKLYDIFGHEVFQKVDVLNPNIQIISEPHSTVSQKYVKLGFEASDTKKAPFDVIAKKENEIVLTQVGDIANPQAQSLSKLIDADSLVIFKHKKPKKIPSLTKKEFLEFEKASELIKFLKEFE